MRPLATGLDFGEVWSSDKTMDVNLTAPSGYAIVKEISIEGEDASEFGLMVIPGILTHLRSEIMPLFK